MLMIGSALLCCDSTALRVVRDPSHGWRHVLPVSPCVFPRGRFGPRIQVERGARGSPRDDIYIDPPRDESGSCFVLHAQHNGSGVASTTWLRSGETHRKQREHVCLPNEPVRPDQVDFLFAGVWEDEGYDKSGKDTSGRCKPQVERDIVRGINMERARHNRRRGALARKARLGAPAKPAATRPTRTACATATAELEADCSYGVEKGTCEQAPCLCRWRAEGCPDEEHPGRGTSVLHGSQHVSSATRRVTTDRVKGVKTENHKDVGVPQFAPVTPRKDRETCFVRQGRLGVREECRVIEGYKGNTHGTTRYEVEVTMWTGDRRVLCYVETVQTEDAEQAQNGGDNDMLEDVVNLMQRKRGRSPTPRRRRRQRERAR